jgi:hypothetical protein
MLRLPFFRHRRNGDLVLGHVGKSRFLPLIRVSASVHGAIIAFHFSSSPVISSSRVGSIGLLETRPPTVL